MFIGLALYNCEEISPLSAFEIGKIFFSSFSLKITSSGYYSYLESGDHPKDHDIFNTDIDDLKIKLESGTAKAFRLYNEDTTQPWISSFGYMTDEFGSFFHISAQLPSTESNNINLESFINKALQNTIIPYGIIYYAATVTDAFYYATGDNLVKLFTYDNPIKWQKETPGLYEGKERYKFSMLRMIYPYNLINNYHLNLKIQGVTLKNWIGLDPSHGVLTAINKDLWLWKVKTDHIDNLNRIFGESEYLVSWQPQEKRIGKKFIP